MKGRRESVIEARYEKLRLEKEVIEKQLKDDKIVGEKRRRRLVRQSQNIERAMSLLYKKMTGFEPNASSGDNFI